MRALVRTSLLTSALACALIAPLHAQTDTSKKTPAKPGRIVGIFDAQTSVPLEGVDIADLIGGGATRTLKSGLFGMAAFSSQNDSALIRVRKVGYEDSTLLVMVGPRDTVPMQVFLRRVAALPEVTVNAKEKEHLPFYMRDFEERVQNHGATGGTVYAPTELRKQDARRLADFLRTKGVGMKTSHCKTIGLLRNGVPYHPTDVTPGSAGIPDEYVDEYEAFVYYRIDEVPLELKKPSILGDCGVLVMYTRMK